MKNTVKLMTVALTFGVLVAGINSGADAGLMDWAKRKIHKVTTPTVHPHAAPAAHPRSAPQYHEEEQAASQYEEPGQEMSTFCCVGRSCGRSACDVGQGCGRTGQGVCVEATDVKDAVRQAAA